MTTAATTLRRSLLASVVAALTVWVCLLSWRPLTENPGDYTGPLLVGVVAVALVGGLARWRGARPLGVLVLQLIVLTPVVLFLTTGLVLPTPGGIGELVRALADGTDSSRRYAAPVPAKAPAVAPLFIVAGVAAALLVDFMALGHRKAAGIGLVLLVLHLVPVNLGVAVPWWLFVAVAAGYLVLLFLEQDELVVRWGEDVESHGSATRPPVGGAAEGTGASTAVRIGALAIVGALALSSVLIVLVPHPPTRQWSAGSKGDSGRVSLTSPLVDMRRDLVRGLDMPLLMVTGDRKPTYVRTAVLADFNGTEWSTGDRRATRIQAASGTPLTLNGVDVRLRRTETDYTFRSNDQFRSSWLPIMSSTSSVRAEGDWRYDRDTMDFASFDEGLSTSGLAWDVVGVDLAYSAVAMDRAPSGLSQVDSTFTDLPRALPRSVEETAERVAGDQPTRFRQARALQDWFRSEFTYSLEQAQPVGSNELVAFLDEDGREGYCEQFAAAMAVMARTLGIPSRVAVGFLSPEAVGPGEWQFSSHDLHAWPELYFAGSGWVRFEPTPASRASSVPAYSEASVEPIAQPSAAPSVTPSASASVAPREQRDQTPESAPEETATGVDVGRLLGAVGALVLVVLLALAPRWVRTRRRTRRLSSGQPEELWAELRDSSLDLGLEWPRGRSPRAVGAEVSRWSSTDQSSTGSTRPDPAETTESGSPESSGGLLLLVEAVEQERFARPDQRHAQEPARLGEVVTDQVTRLAANASRSAQWRARWAPRSLVGRGRRS